MEHIYALGIVTCVCRRGGNRTHVTPPHLDGALRVYKARPTANISNPPKDSQQWQVACYSGEVFGKGGSDRTARVRWNAVEFR